MFYLCFGIWLYHCFIPRKAPGVCAAMGCFHGCLPVLQWAPPATAITASATAATGQRILLVRHGDPWHKDGEPIGSEEHEEAHETLDVEGVRRSKLT